MNDDERDRLLAELLAHPQDRESILGGTTLSTQELRELVGLVDTADAVWLAAQTAPTLEDDPVAAMLGLVPSPACVLNPSALSNARRRARLNVSRLAERLCERGWQFSKTDVFGWENGVTTNVPPSVIQAIAEILNVPVDGLIAPTTATAPVSEVLTALRNSPVFDQLVARWSRVRQVSRSVAIAALEERAMATVHRGDRPDTGQLLDSLSALVSAVEQDE